MTRGKMALVGQLRCGSLHDGKFCSGVTWVEGLVSAESGFLSSQEQEKGRDLWGWWAVRRRLRVDSRLRGNGGRGSWDSMPTRFFVAKPPQNDMWVEGKRVMRLWVVIGFGMRVGSCLRRNKNKALRQAQDGRWEGDGGG